MPAICGTATTANHLSKTWRRFFGNKIEYRSHAGMFRDGMSFCTING